ncbi:MAG TPA: OmpA family protein [Terriglobia bacterium]|jgi:chemotaxis protein MotB|nr:OmpA family protein [Terriglobia bacterium]
MSRRKKAEGHVNHERWLISYSDFVTLLFALFVVLFSSSQVDKRKVGMIAQAIQAAFEQLGIFNSSNARVPVAQSEPMPFSNARSATNAAGALSLPRVITPPSGTPNPVDALWRIKAIKQELEQALAPQLRVHDVRIRVNREGLVISLEEIGFFPSGSAVLKPEAIPILAKIARILANAPEDIRVEGHTDNVPIHNSQFASNWSLSTARAVEVLNLLITRFGIAPQRLSAAGYAQFHPVASNATDQGRAMNRRVDVVVLRSDLQTPPDLPIEISGTGGAASAANSAPQKLLHSKPER